MISGLVRRSMDGHFDCSQLMMMMKMIESLLLLVHVVQFPFHYILICCLMILEFAAQ